MNRIESILVPVDFEAQSEHALAYAVDLAETLGATVHVITTYEVPIVGFPDGVLVAAAEIVSHLVESSQKSLDEMCAPYKARKVTVTSHLEQGDPQQKILEVARDKHVGLIVMGTHGRRGVSRALIGSVAENVIRRSEIPVLTVH